MLDRALDKYRSDGLKTVCRLGYRYLVAALIRKSRRITFAFRSRCFGDEFVRCQGVLIELEWNRFDSEATAPILNGDYESEEATYVRRYLCPEVDVIELGGGIGVVSGVIDEILAGNRKHIVVEANPALIPILERTAQLNDCDFKICNRAYSTSSESLQLRTGDLFWSGSLYDRPRAFGTTNVEPISLSNLCERFDVDEFSLVVDIEGGEFELLSAELELLKSNCDVLVVEFHEFTGNDIDDYRQRLRSNGFELLEFHRNVHVFRNNERDRNP